MLANFPHLHFNYCCLTSFDYYCPVINHKEESRVYQNKWIKENAKPNYFSKEFQCPKISSSGNHTQAASRASSALTNWLLVFYFLYVQANVCKWGWQCRCFLLFWLWHNKHCLVDVIWDHIEQLIQCTALIAIIVIIFIHGFCARLWHRQHVQIQYWQGMTSALIISCRNLVWNCKIFQTNNCWMVDPASSDRQCRVCDSTSLKGCTWYLDTFR